MVEVVSFPNYSTGAVVDSGAEIGLADFTFTAVLTPSALRYGMLLSRDRCGVGADQFRVCMFVDGRLGVCTGGGNLSCHMPPVASAHDGAQWGSPCTTPRPLEEGAAVHFALVRRGVAWALFLDGEMCIVGGQSGHGALAAADGGWVRQPAVHALHANAHSSLRVGSRFPGGEGSAAHNPFHGTIQGAELLIGIALTEEEVRAAAGEGVVPVAEEVEGEGGGGGGAAAAVAVAQAPRDEDAQAEAGGAVSSSSSSDEG